MHKLSSGLLVCGGGRKIPGEDSEEMSGKKVCYGLNTCPFKFRSLVPQSIMIMVPGVLKFNPVMVFGGKDSRK